MGSLECAEEVEAPPPQPLLLSSGDEDLRSRLAALLELQLAARRALLEGARAAGPRLFEHLARRDSRDCRRAMVDYASRILRATNASFESFEFATVTFDRYVTACLAEGVAILDNRAQALYTMLACMFMATKIIETQPVALSDLASGCESMVLAEELNIVAKLDYLLPPLVTPSSFVRHLLSLWPEHVRYPKIYDDAQTVLAVCSKERLYVKFAYSTLAAAAIVYAFTSIAVHCQDWLEHVPDCILKLDHDPASFGHQIGHGTVSECYQMMLQFLTTAPREESGVGTELVGSPVATARAAGRSTPTSVTELEEPMTPHFGGAGELCSFSPAPQLCRATRAVARRIAGEMGDMQDESGSRKRAKHGSEGEEAVSTDL